MAVCGRSLPTLVINDTMVGIGVSTVLRRVPREVKRRLPELSDVRVPANAGSILKYLSTRPCSKEFLDAIF